MPPSVLLQGSRSLAATMWTHQYRVVKWAPGMPPCTSCAGEPNRLSRAPDRIFKVMGKSIAHAGAVGDGQTCKVVNQIIVALNIQAVSEALVFAPKAGADPGKVRAALMGGFASSKILEVHAERVWVWYGKSKSLEPLAKFLSIRSGARTPKLATTSAHGNWCDFDGDHGRISVDAASDSVFSSNFGRVWPHRLSRSAAAVMAKERSRTRSAER